MRRLLALGIALLVAMALGRVLTDHVPLASVSTEPFVRTTGVGHTLSLRYADLEVTGVRSAAFLDPGSAAIAPGGRYLVVDATVTAKHRPQRIGYAAVIGGDGRTYAPTTRGGCTNVSFTAPTSLPYHAMYCFDLPRSALAGSTLEVSSGDPAFGGGQARDDVAHVELGIDRSDAARLWATKTGYRGFAGGLDRPDRKPLTLKERS